MKRKESKQSKDVNISLSANQNSQVFLISKILADKSLDIYNEYNLSIDLFLEFKEHIEFILDYHNKYKKVPEVVIFKNRFPKFPELYVLDDYKYVINDLITRKYLNKYQEIINNSFENGDIEAEYTFPQIQRILVEYQNKLDSLESDKKEGFVQTSKEERLNSINSNDYISTGLDDLDNYLHGFKKGEDLITVFGRTNIGKTWIIIKFLSHLTDNYKCGFISPEMSSAIVMHRYDTLKHHFPNNELMKGNYSESYKKYVNNLKNDNERDNFLFFDLEYFDNELTTPKIETLIKKKNLKALAIDGISFIKNYRATYNQNTTDKLNDISFDLIQISKRHKIPIIIAVQANRTENKTNEKTLSLYAIRDSDAIAQNSTRVLSLGYDKNEKQFYIGIKKNRYGRMGMDLVYNVDWNLGEFEYAGEDEGGENTVKSKSSKRRPKDREGASLDDDGRVRPLTDEEEDELF